MNKLLLCGLVAGAGYLGWRALQQNAPASGSGASSGSSSEEAAYQRYLASDAYRTSPASMRLSHDAFVRAWRSIPDGAKPHVLRSFGMTQPQVVQETISNPAFAQALAQASAAWRSGGVSGIGNYSRS